MAHPIQSQLLNVDPLQLFPTPRPGGRPRQHRRRSSSTPACSPRGACVCIIAMPAGVLACASPSEIPGDPLQQPPSGRVHCGGHAEDRRQAASSQGLDPGWVLSLHVESPSGRILCTETRSDCSEDDMVCVSDINSKTKKEMSQLMIGLLNEGISSAMRRIKTRLRTLPIQ